MAVAAGKAPLAGRRGSLVGAAAGVALATLVVLASLGGPASSVRGDVEVRIVDATAALGSVFHPGVILGAAANSSAVMLSGIGVYLKPQDFTLPVLAAGPVSGPTLANLTSLVAPYFANGGTYGLAWNGSAWLVTGQASWDGETNDGTAVIVSGDKVENVTSWIAPYFHGGGIWGAGWNGTSWMLAGNSSRQPALVGWDGSRVTDFSALLPPSSVFPASKSFIQVVAWNGSAWLVGGTGILGLVQSGRYGNLLPESPYVTNGVYSVGWNGTAWLVGGGGARVSVVVGDAVRAGPALPSAFDQVVLLLAPVETGWLIGGKGSTPTGGFAPGLAYWSGDAGDPVRDLAGMVPSSFTGGEIQGGALDPGVAGGVLLAGMGDYNVTTGFGLGALAIVTISPAHASTPELTGSWAMCARAEWAGPREPPARRSNGRRPNRGL